MNVAFRTDASSQIGSGHVMRCLVLARALKNGGAHVDFFCRSKSGDLISRIEKAGFHVVTLPDEGDPPSSQEPQPYAQWLGFSWKSDADQVQRILAGKPVDWMVVDHYALDARWENAVRPVSKRLLAIDDLAKRSHACDILLDTNWHAKPEARYATLVPAGCRTLYGPAYALLRDEFTEALSQRRVRDAGVHRVLIFMGGGDPSNLTGMALDALQPFSGRLEIDVVVGSSNLHANAIQNTVQTFPRGHYHVQTSSMSELIVKADLAVGAGGQANWERVLLGLPSIVIPWAENQEPGARALATQDVIHLIEPSQVSAKMIFDAVQRCLSTPETVAAMSRNALALSAGVTASGAERVVAAMMERS